jgi:hypothetical protein
MGSSSHLLLVTYDDINPEGVILAVPVARRRVMIEDGDTI